MLKDRDIVVVGAGIAGLAVARALAGQGARVTVLEQAAEIAEVGAGIQISPNGFAVLRALGLGAALAERAVQGRAVNLIDHRGAPVARLDLTGLASRDYYFLHRADLIAVLADGARAAGAGIRTGARVVAVTDGARPRVDLADGTALDADLVVAADGLHSVLRPVLNPGTGMFFTGQVAWRAVVPGQGPLVPEVRLFMGPHRHLVCYPLRGGRMMNLVAVEERRDWVPESWSHADNPDNLRRAFAGFGPEVQALLARVDTVHLWGLFRHPVAPVWHAEATVLLGDAAHPTLPFMAQGACMGLEDAWALADTLARGAGLAAYQRRRMDRVRRVVAAATGNAWKYHLSAPPLRWGAHLALRMASRLAPERLLRQYDWIYGFDPLRG